jgi:hypothetical protein
MKQQAHTPPVSDAQISERIAEFERLLAAALRRILAESAPDAEAKHTRTSAPGRCAGAPEGSHENLPGTPGQTHTLLGELPGHGRPDLQTI